MAQSIPIPGQPVRGSTTGRPIMALFDLLGRTWAMGVIWQLGDGPCTFRQLRARCDGMSPTVLNQRLKELRATGLVNASDAGYELTELGRDLFEVLTQMKTTADRWATCLNTDRVEKFRS